MVVNCAGRTRSIIGAQSLINAGIPNPVVALKDGTMGWQLAGYQVAENNDRRAPAVSERTLKQVQAAAVDVSTRAGVRTISAEQLDRFRGERATRTLYVFDVRTPEEYEAGHLHDAVHAFGGQLVQTTDKFVAVRGARIVLVDDTEARARMTASWLRQMGWDDVFVLAGGIGTRGLVAGSRQAKLLGIDRVTSPTMSPQNLQSELAAGRAVLIDIADPRRFKTSHIAGAWYAVRSKLPSGLDRFRQGRFARVYLQRRTDRKACCRRNRNGHQSGNCRIGRRHCRVEGCRAADGERRGEIAASDRCAMVTLPAGKQNAQGDARLPVVGSRSLRSDKRDKEVKFRALPPRT